MTEKKKIVFLTGTRADFGKLKPLINVVENSDLFVSFLFEFRNSEISKF